LEYVREGRLEIQQGNNFDDLLVRRARPKAAVQDPDDA
jgi:chromatin segregation and condensation protein Rec8/ScpA/Scc1 (kleisin family)